ncbi:hypothetical protein MTR_5g008580 [Medicago truncatula]|uniref:Uncharacterized protein n=1 Tax=Medicago truncatula TaxID=3880 RepID=G7K7X8_MEDTR|nr:hypothetical protein MTR_5g008580 [Medicago truncatula]
MTLLDYFYVSNQFFLPEGTELNGRYPIQALYGLNPPKLVSEGIEPETSGGANSKISSQPLGQPQMG